MSGKRPHAEKKLSNPRNCGLMRLVYMSVDSDVCSGEYGAIIVIKIWNPLVGGGQKKAKPCGQELDGETSD